MGSVRSCRRAARKFERSSVRSPVSRKTMHRLEAKPASSTRCTPCAASQVTASCTSSASTASLAESTFKSRATCHSPQCAPSVGTTCRPHPCQPRHRRDRCPRPHAATAPCGGGGEPPRPRGSRRPQPRDAPAAAAAPPKARFLGGAPPAACRRVRAEAESRPPSPGRPARVSARDGCSGTRAPLLDSAPPRCPVLAQPTLRDSPLPQQRRGDSAAPQAWAACSFRIEGVGSSSGRAHLGLSASRARRRPSTSGAPRRRGAAALSRSPGPVTASLSVASAAACHVATTKNGDAN